MRQVAWNLAVLDEAHRLRNVYKPTNKIGNAIKSALAPFDKLLLTATPLQNTLLELFGLVSIIDEHIFGDIKSFKSQFSRLETDGDFRALRDRLKPICQRTLRRQVLEYIPFTNRIALVEEFIPSEPEQKLYNLVSDYLPTCESLRSSSKSAPVDDSYTQTALSFINIRNCRNAERTGGQAGESRRRAKTRRGAAPRGC